jgi:hypothetical protein
MVTAPASRSASRWYGGIISWMTVWVIPAARSVMKVDSS